MEIRKVTAGFIIQRWDAKTGEYLGQEFIAGDEVVWEDGLGEPIDEPDFPLAVPIDL